MRRSKDTISDAVDVGGQWAAHPGRSGSIASGEPRDNEVLRSRLGRIDSKGELSVTRRLSRLLPLVALASLIAGGGPGAASSSTARVASASGANCCKVTYNAAKTHVQVTGTVAYKGEPLSFSLSSQGPCTAPAGKGLARVSSKWIPVRNMVAGYHWIDVVQRVDGKVVFTKSAKFFIKGTAQLRKPTATITSGPKGVVTAATALFKFTFKDVDKLECRLDNRTWKLCSTGWAMYENLAVGPHTFTVRAHSIDRKSYVDANRTFVVSAPHP